MKRIVALVLGLNLAAAVFAADAVPLNVRDFGAKGDGLVKDTAAIQKALDACAAAGGGTVLVPEGLYLTGSLTLGANTTLQLSSHTSLIGSPDIADYPLVTIRWEGEFREGHRALISATNAANVTIVGSVLSIIDVLIVRLRCLVLAASVPFRMQIGINIDP